jgi:hypothetical protein
MTDETVDEICMPLDNVELNFGSVQNKAMDYYLAEMFIVVRLQKNHLQ